MLRFLSRMKPIYRSAAILTACIIFVNLVLLLYGYLSAGSDHVFQGLLYNPIDGQSYFLKMKEGYNDNWRFTLAYSCDKSDGAYVYLYYIFLGHLARWLGLSIPFIFHFARLINAGILVFALAQLISKILHDDQWAKRALWLTCLGSSMGYLALMFGVLSDNERVAEGYPFLSIFGNPHFTLGMALFVFIIILLMGHDTWKRAIKAGILTLLLAIIQPFLVISIFVVTGFYSLWKLLRERHLDYRQPLLIAMGGGIYLVYQYWALITDPVLSQWIAQNSTPSPPWWDFILCTSPALIYGILALIRRKQLAFQPHPIIVIWLIALGLLTYAPFALQRRFMAGIYIPLVIIAYIGVTAFKDYHRLTIWLNRLLWIFSLPGAILFLMLPVYGIATTDPAFFLTRGEAEALSWLNVTGKPDSLVLASPSMGLFIPTYTQDCVFYGHPFETLNQEANEQLVTNMYRGIFSDTSAKTYLSSQGVDYIIFGPREQKLGTPGFIQDLSVVFSKDGVTIYEYPRD